jgi:hypothetical protein
VGFQNPHLLKQAGGGIGTRRPSVGHAFATKSRNCFRKWWPETGSNRRRRLLRCLQRDRVARVKSRFTMEAMDTDAHSCHAMPLWLHSLAKVEVGLLQNISAIVWTVLSRGNPESTRMRVDAPDFTVGMSRCEVSP